MPLFVSEILIDEILTRLEAETRLPQIMRLVAAVNIDDDQAQRPAILRELRTMIS